MPVRSPAVRCRRLRPALRLLPFLLAAAVARAADVPATPVLTNLAVIKGLSPEQSARSQPVRVRGVITSAGSRYGDYFLQNGDGAIYLPPPARSVTVQSGDEVEVEGVTGVGGFAPVLVLQRLTALGRAPLPEARPAEVPGLVDGRYDALRVRVAGLVRGFRLRPEDSDLPVLMGLNVSGLEVMALIKGPRDGLAVLTNLNGARVEVTGICAPRFNSQRQVTSTAIHVTPQDELRLLDPGEARPGQLPRLPVAQLLRYDPRRPNQGLVQIEGTVTAVISSLSFFLQDETGGVLVRVRGPLPIRPGERLLLSGMPQTEMFLGASQFGVYSQVPDAATAFFATESVERRGSGPLPAALWVAEPGLSESGKNHRRVALEARVLGVTRSAVSDRIKATLQLGSTLIELVGRADPAEDELPAVGSVVQVAGVLDRRLQPDEEGQPLRLYLAAWADLTLRAGPPGNPIRLLTWAVGVLSSLALVSLAWVFLLRRSVRQQTAALAQANANLSQANRAKSEFLANMSHEIRTPMNAVLSLVQLLQRQSLSSEQRNIVRRVGLSGQSLLRLLNDILDFSKIEAGQLALEARSFELESLLGHLDELFGETARAKGLRWQVEPFAPALGALQGDALRLEQILSNLVSNAIKFTRQGEVRVVTRVLGTTRDYARVRFEVRDTGIGIEPAVLDRLFQPFTQADPSINRLYGGTGLGLSICRRLVALMGGTIGAESVPQRGTLFWVELSLARTSEAPRAEADAAPAPAGRRLAGRRILVVDDNVLNLDLTEWALREEAATVVLQSDAREALECLRREVGRFDAVLMDLQMPGMDGLTAIRSLRQELGLGRLPVIAYTAAVLPGEQQEALAAGANDVVPKPVDLERLVQVLRRWAPAGAGAEPALPAPAEAPPAASVFPELPGLDTRHAAHLLRGNGRLFEKLLREFRAQHTGLAGRLRAELQAGRPLEVARRVHAVRGVTGYLGALELGRAAAALEEALREGRGDVEPLLEAFVAGLDTVLEAAGALK